MMTTSSAGSQSIPEATQSPWSYVESYPLHTVASDLIEKGFDAVDLEYPGDTMRHDTMGRREVI